MNNEQRETKEVKIGEHVLIINAYITGREARDIDAALMEKIEMSQSTNKGTEIKGLYGGQLKERQDMQIKAVIVSFDGKKEKIIDLVLDLPNYESEKVMKIVREIADPKKEDADK